MKSCNISRIETRVKFSPSRLHYMMRCGMISLRTPHRFRTTGEPMPDELTSSTVPRRQLGRYLEQLREDSGLKRKDAAKALERSTPTIWRIETGQTPMRGIEFEAMCRIYGPTPEMTTFLASL